MKVLALPGDSNQLWNTVSIACVGYEASAVMMGLDMLGVSISTGSACSTGAIEPSHVIQALGYDDAIVNSTVRFSFGYPTTSTDLNNGLRVISNYFNSN